GTLVLRRLKRPLEAVIDQARAIGERRFILTPEPKVPELRQLSSAMNSVVLRLKGMFEEEAGRLEIIRREANNDALTGLVNRRYFMAQLRALIESEENSGGSLMLIRVAHLAELNRRLGRNPTDSLLKSISRVIKTYAARFPEGLAARLNGADFGLILPAGEARLIADELLATLVRETADLLADEPVAFIGIGQFHYGLNLGALLSQIDSAMAGAEASGINCVREAISFYANYIPRSAEEWADQIRHALSQDKVQLASFPVVDFSQRVVHRECPLRLMLNEEGEWLPAGRFLPIAERLGLTVAIDLAAITLGMAELTSHPAMPDLAINVSARSIQDETFRKQVRTLLQKQPDVARRLWLEVSENGALAHFDAFRLFRNELIDCGCKIGLEHFGRQFSQIGRLHDMGLDYLKVDASFIRGIEDNPGNQVFLKGLTSIAHNIGLQVFAESVVSMDELHMLSSLAFDGATGPVIQESQH
ncbi:MAG: EAL domain-containing protein, partial [Burkholderiaceae bacterium]